MCRARSPIRSRSALSSSRCNASPRRSEDKVPRARASFRARTSRPTAPRGVHCAAVAGQPVRDRFDAAVTTSGSRTARPRAPLSPRPGAPHGQDRLRGRSPHPRPHNRSKPMRPRADAVRARVTSFRGCCRAPREPSQRDSRPTAAAGGFTPPDVPVGRSPKGVRGRGRFLGRLHVAGLLWREVRRYQGCD